MYLRNFVNWWKIEHDQQTILDAGIDLIVPISYTMLRLRPTAATQANLAQAIDFKRHFPQARVAFSSCSYPFPGADRIEDNFRMAELRMRNIEPIIASPMINSIGEARNIRKKLIKQSIMPKAILLTTGELHSRSAFYIWKKIFPEARIYISCISHRLEVQPDALVLNQQTMPRWVMANVSRQIALQTLPLHLVAKIHHKTLPQE